MQCKARPDFRQILENSSSVAWASLEKERRRSMGPPQIREQGQVTVSAHEELQGHDCKMPDFHRQASHSAKQLNILSTQCKHLDWEEVIELPWLHIEIWQGCGCTVALQRTPRKY